MVAQNVPKELLDTLVPERKPVQTRLVMRAYQAGFSDGMRIGRLTKNHEGTKIWNIAAAKPRDRSRDLTPTITPRKDPILRIRPNATVTLSVKEPT